LIALGLGMIGDLFWRLVRDRAGDLVDERRRARILVLVVMGLDWRPQSFTIIQNTALLAFAAWLALRLLPVPAPGAGAAAALPARGEEARLTERLRVLVEVEKAHPEPDLTFADFARRMSAPERTVRQLINHRLGHDHFRAFLNACRVAEQMLACAQAAGLLVDLRDFRAAEAGRRCGAVSRRCPSIGELRALAPRRVGASA
jgi:hypothetical protein